ncbi:MAG: ABC transporter permease, partial [Lewinella sp.]|nr:ABC transporter permease [Lewinella sp.]
MKSPVPPQFFLRFFKWFCDPGLHPFVEGDLYELYCERVEALGKKKADRRFALDVLLLLRPGIVRSFPFIDHLINHLDMLKNYFKIGFRNLSKHRFFSLINIAGMTIGMTCFVLITLYIQYELSYDRQHTKADRIYRVVQQQKGNVFRGSDFFALAPMPLTPAMREQFPEVEAATTLQIREALFVRGEDVFYEEGLFADEYLFEVFDYPIVEGNGETALADQNAIIVTEAMARKYFGKKSPIGQTLFFEDDRPLTVRAVVADPPKNQHFTFDYITSFKNYPFYKYDIGQWNSNNYRAYVVLPEGYNPKVLEDKLSAFDDELKAAYSSFSFEPPKFFIQPLTDIHLYSHINMEMSANGDIRYVYLAASIAFIILLLAAINYMNLSTARTSQRAKEVGMRKVMGANKGQLVNQFMTESVLITFFSFGLAIGLSFALLPAFNRLLGLDIPYFLDDNHLLLIGMLVTAILFGVVSGLYPALLSTRVAPAQAFKSGWFKHRKDGNRLRQILVIGQFSAAIVLAISSVVIYQQLRYIQNKKLGYNRDQVVYVPYQQQAILDKTETIRSELLKHPQIDQVAFANSLPLNMLTQGIAENWEGREEGEELPIYRNWVDYDFIDLFDIELVEGRNFSPEFPTDSTESYILNESAVKALGWESAVGKEFEEGRVIGVVKDFHIQPFNLAIEPLWMRFINHATTYYNGNILIKINGSDSKEAVAYLQKTLKTILPNVPFEHHFMDESLNQLYESERRFGEVFNLFTLLALFIACMGLFGLVTHQVLQRTKEIGIRKVLGASVSSIVNLLSKDFIRLVIISALVAVPIAWW